METIIHHSDATFDYILHLSDIHIRLSSRFKEYNLVFQAFLKQLRTFPEGRRIVVITGDLFHTKNELTPDSVVLCLNFLGKVAKLAPVVLIPGNHDLVMHNLDKCDTISAVLHRSNLKNVHYLKASGVYRFGNLVMIHNSLWRESSSSSSSNAWIHADKKVWCEHDDDVLLHLYHGTVGACQSSNGFVMTNTLNLSKFDGADMVLLGDIHKHQSLKPHIAYAGSMISQNFLETDDDHGFLAWDVPSRTPTLHRLANPYCFRQIDVLPDDRLVHQGRVYEEWNDLFGTESFSSKMHLQILIHEHPSYNTRLIREACKGVGIQQPRIRHVQQARSSSSSSSTIDQGEEISSTTTLRKHIQTYLLRFMVEELGIESEETREECRKLLQQHVDLFQSHTVESSANVGGRWKLLELSFDHLFGYGPNNTLQFSPDHTFVDAQVVGIFGCNSAGKSTLIDILVFMLYGRITRYASGNSIPKELIHESHSSFRATLRIQVGSDVYRIEKRGKRDPKTLRIKIYESMYQELPGDDNVIDLTEEHRFKTDKLIRNLIGPIDQFLHLSICLQISNKSFKDMTQKERKEFMYTILRLDGFEDYRQLLHGQDKDLHTQERILDTHLTQSPHQSHSAWKIALKESRREWDGAVRARGEAEERLREVETEMRRTQGIRDRMEQVSMSLSTERKRYDDLRRRGDALGLEMDAGTEDDDDGDDHDHDDDEGCETDSDRIDDEIVRVEGLLETLERCISKDGNGRAGPIQTLCACPDFSYTQYLRLCKSKRRWASSSSTSSSSHDANEEKEETKTTKTTKTTTNMDLCALQQQQQQSTKSLPPILPYPDNCFVFTYFLNAYYVYKAHEVHIFMDREVPLIREKKERMKNYRLRMNELEIRQSVLQKEWVVHEQATYDDSCEHCARNPFRHRKRTLEKEMKTLEKEKSVLQQKHTYDENDLHRRVSEANELVKTLYQWDANDECPRKSYWEYGEDAVPSLNMTMTFPMPVDTIESSLYTIERDLGQRVDAVHSFVDAMNAFINRHLMLYRQRCQQTYLQHTQFLTSLDAFLVATETKRRHRLRMEERDRLRQQLHDLRQQQFKVLQVLQRKSILHDLYECQASLASLQATYHQLKHELAHTSSASPTTMDEDLERTRNAVRMNMENEVQTAHAHAQLETRYKDWRRHSDELDALRTQRQRVQLLVKLTDRDGFPLYLLRKSMGIFNGYINDILQHFVDRRIHFEIETDGNVQFCTKSEDSNMTFQFYGGMESLMIDMATKITFAHFGLCPMSSFFMLDENISVLDEHHLQHIHVLFEFLKQHFDHILVISHLPTIKNMVDRAITIRKKDGYSHVHEIDL